MVGDRVSTDIKFGNLNGFQTFLVLTGEGTKDELEKSKLNAEIILSIKDLN